MIGVVVPKKAGDGKNKFKIAAEQQPNNTGIIYDENTGKNTLKSQKSMQGHIIKQLWKQTGIYAALVGHIFTHPMDL